MEIIQSNLVSRPIFNMRLHDYYLLSIKLCLSKTISPKEIQQIFDKYLLNLSLASLPKDKDRVRRILNLCLGKGAKVEIPIFKDNYFKTEDDSTEEFSKFQFFENKQVFDFLINNHRLSLDDKCKLDTLLVQSMMTDLVLLNYKKQTNFLSLYLNQKLQESVKFNCNFSALEELERVLHRGFIFNNQLSRFLALSSILTYRDIFDNLGSQFKLICFQEFSKLSIIGKKALTSILIKNKNEEAIFNLLSFGLKLNWDIPVSDGKKNLVAFELMYSLPWVKKFIDHPHLDIRLTNSHGENILHLVGACALSDSSVEMALRRKLHSISQRERNNILFQVNEEGFTPLMKAVIFQDEKLIDFILEFNVSPWDRIEGAPLYESALDLLNLHILNSTGQGMLSSLMGYFKDSFWGLLAKKWNAEYFYIQLQRDLSQNRNKSKPIMKI